jgi:hypothetical protein
VQLVVSDAHVGLKIRAGVSGGAARFTSYVRHSATRITAGSTAEEAGSHVAIGNA